MSGHCLRLFYQIISGLEAVENDVFLEIGRFILKTKICVSLGLTDFFSSTGEPSAAKQVDY